MNSRRVTLTTFVCLLAFGSAVALAQSVPAEAPAEAPVPVAAVEAVREPSTVAVQAPSGPSTSLATGAVEDAPVDVPEATQSDWAPDINLDALPPTTQAASGYVRKPKPRKMLSDAGENALGSNSWGQGSASANAQAELLSRAGRRERAVDPRKRSDLTKLSRVMGALHALRVSCAGRDDQTYRSRMATMLDLEAPDNGDLRDPLVDAFNGGFQAYGRGASTCPTDARVQEASLAKEGYGLARTLSARYRPASALASNLPPANQPRQDPAVQTSPAKVPVVASPQTDRPSWPAAGQ
jgi:uncharacterized protein (TIGR02301 family)